MSKLNFAARNQTRDISNIFSNLNEDIQEENSVEIAIDDIREFKDHPFKVLDNPEMDVLVDSISANGIINPVIVRQDRDTMLYELISGHRRVHAARRLSLKTVPAIVKDLTNEEATIMMVDSNIQRETLLPSERAFAYKMKFDALSRQGKSMTGEFAKTTQGLAKEDGISDRTVERYIHLTQLSRGLLDLTDDKTLPFTVAVELSYLCADAQSWLEEYIRNYGSISLKQAKAIHSEADRGVISTQKIEEILNPDTVQEHYKVSLSYRKLKKYFPVGYTQKQVEEVIFNLLDDWKKQH